jgi:hypothetical protein
MICGGFKSFVKSRNCGLFMRGLPKQQRRSEKQNGEKRIQTKPAPHTRLPVANMALTMPSRRKRAIVAPRIPTIGTPK